MKPNEITARERWKALHRMQRVIKREQFKASMDVLVYGSGVVYIPNDGDPKHIPIGEFHENQ